MPWKLIEVTRSELDSSTLTDEQLIRLSCVLGYWIKNNSIIEDEDVIWLKLQPSVKKAIGNE